MLALLASVLTEDVPFQAQSLARSLQAELEKLRVAEHAAASDKEEAQHLKVSWLCHDSRSCRSRTTGMVIISEDWGAKPVVTLQERVPLWLKDSRATPSASLQAEISGMP